MADFDLVLSWFCAVPSSVQQLFHRETRFIQLPTPPNRTYRDQVIAYGWPHPLRGMLSSLGIDPKSVGRIAMMAFSEGGAGLGAMLKSADAGYIETLIAIDCIHAQWNPQGHPNSAHDNIAPGYLDPWIAYASLAAKAPTAIGGLPPGERVFVMTHSAVVPPSYVSTTQTARAILDAVFGGSNWPSANFPSGIADRSFNPPLVLKGNSVNANRSTTYDSTATSYVARQNGLYAAGFNDLDPSGVNDHIFQAQVVLPSVCARILASRWNAIDPGSTCTGVSGNSCAGVSPVVLPTGYVDDPQDASLKCPNCDLPTLPPDDEPPEGEWSAILQAAIIAAGVIGIGAAVAWGVRKSRGGGGVVPKSNPAAKDKLQQLSAAAWAATDKAKAQHDDAVWSGKKKSRQVAIDLHTKAKHAHQAVMSHAKKIGKKLSPTSHQHAVHDHEYWIETHQDRLNNWNPDWDD